MRISAQGGETQQEQHSKLPHSSKFIDAALRLQHALAWVTACHQTEFEHVRGIQLEKSNSTMAKHIIINFTLRRSTTCACASDASLRARMSKLNQHLRVSLCVLSMLLGSFRSSPALALISSMACRDTKKGFLAAFSFKRTYIILKNTKHFFGGDVNQSC